MNKVNAAFQQWQHPSWQGASTFSEAENECQLGFQMLTEFGEFSCEVSCSGSKLMYFCYAPNLIPESKYRIAIETISHINPNLTFGNVEIHSEDKHQICFRMGCILCGNGLNTIALSQYLDALIESIKAAYPAILSACFAGIQPRLAVARAFGIEDMPEVSAKWLKQDNSMLDRPTLQSGLLSDWGREISFAISNEADSEEWRMFGTAAIVIHSSMVRAKEMLARMALEAGIQFASLDEEGFMQIPMSECPFYQNSPIMVYIEPGDWFKSELVDENAFKKSSEFRSRLVANMETFNPEHPVFYVTSAYKLDDIRSSLRKCGLFDRYFNIPDPTVESIGKEFIDLIGSANCDESIFQCPAKVGRLLKRDLDCEVRMRLAALHMKRTAQRERRKLEFVDLVVLGMHDFEETTQRNCSEQERIAIHESGHVVIALLDSEGKNVPECSSIVPSSQFEGAVIDSCDYGETNSELLTYKGLRHQIRTLLAGRAAEEVVYGTENISLGSCGDLEESVRLLSRAFGYWGFAPSMSNLDMSASNLAVIVGKPSSSEYAMLEQRINQFMAEEYKIVASILMQHQRLLNMMSSVLMANGLLEQYEIWEIYSEYLNADTVVAMAA